MTDDPIVSQPPLLPDNLLPPKKPQNKLNLHDFWLHPNAQPASVAHDPTIQRLLELLGPLDWGHFPERNLARSWGQPTIPFAALAAAGLIKLNEHLASMQDLHRCLTEHSGFIPLLGFPPASAPRPPVSFQPRASLPTPRHFTRLLRALPNAALQFLLTDTVRLIRAELAACGAPPITCISLDTKHILAWVTENNPKAYVTHRFDKTRQPAGDPDCRLGCKRRHNQRAPVTPTTQPRPAAALQVGEFYWGYGSGVVVTQVPGWGEFVLAELTQPFDQGDLSYFFPLMRQVEDRLGYRPPFATFDAAFDAWYVYAYFHRENDPSAGFAAVPFSEKGGVKVDGRRFDPAGLPICAAGLPMPLEFTYTDRTKALIEHERGKYVCPLRFPTRAAKACPVHNKQWKKGGCSAMMPTSIGARLRYTLDRHSDPYKDLYRQRTAVERINSQAWALGIERPHLRNGTAIANQNTLIYILINLRFLQRLRRRQPAF